MKSKYNIIGVHELFKTKKTNRIKASKCDALIFLMKLNTYFSSITMSTILYPMIFADCLAGTVPKNLRVEHKFKYSGN